MECKVVLILLLSLFAFCSGESECNSKNQCSDLWAAKKCGKVKYCIEENWSKLKPTGHRDNVCDICLRMVKEARDTLQSNETREQLLEVFEGSCRLLVLKPAVEACDKIVDQFVPELVEILSSQMDPEVVCSVAKLCNNEAFRAALKNSKECVLCEKFTEAAAQELNLVSSESFQNSVLRLCRSAGSYSDACSYLGLKYSSLLYDDSKTVLNGKPCEATSICPEGLSSPQPVREHREPLCPLCKRVMTNIREQLLRVKSAEEFSENVLSICGRMGFSESACSKTFGPSLYEKLKSFDALPEIFCQITYCKKKSAEEEVFPIWPLLPAQNNSFGSSDELTALSVLEYLEAFFPLVEQEEMEAHKPQISYGDPIENPFFLSPGVYITESGYCKTCNDLLGVLSKSAKTREEYSEEMLKNFCQEVQNAATCERFVSNFAPVLAEAYAQGVVSNKMCEDLVPSCKIKRNDLSDDANSYNRTCNFCINAVRTFKHGDLVSWGHKQCNSLPENSRRMCSSVFASIHSALENSTENEICHNLQLCGSSAMILPNISNAHATIKLDKSACEVCIDTVESLVDLMKNPNSDMIIELVFHSLCAILPYGEAKLCFKVVDVLGVKNLEKFIENLKPNEVCADIYMCRKKEEFDTPVIPVSSEEVSGVTKKIPCRFCLMAIRTLLDQLQDNKTEESIRKALDGLCKYFPEETRDTCRNLINEYTEDLIDMIIADFNATEICTYLKICPTRYLLKDADKKDFSVFNIQTNEVRDWDEDSWRWTVGTAQKSAVETAAVRKPIEEDFQNFHKIVQECALCEALVGVISTHKNMLDKNYDFSANAHLICSIVPENKRKMCTTMVISYGPSIVNLLVDKKVDKDEICVRVDLCDPKMQAKVNQPVSVTEKFISDKNNSCLQGPIFWCANAENAEKCGTFLHCQETVWKNWKNPPRRSNSD